MKKICGVKATGSMIIVEMLTAQECAGTTLDLGYNSKSSSPQGYIIDIGPALNRKEWGFDIGDRVLLQGKYVPVPFERDSERELGVVMPSDIKCVLEEE